MTLMRLACSSTLAALMVIAVAQAQIPSETIGPVEKRAKPVTPENPIPRRIHSVTPRYPPEAIAIGASGRVTVRAVLDEFGRVAEVRLINRPLLGFTVQPPPDTATHRAATEAVLASVADAVQQWQYEAPIDGPIAFNVNFTLSTKGEVTLLGQQIAETVVVSTAPPPPPPPPGGAVRVGGGVRPPQQIARVNPIYPAEAREQRVQGVVILEALIDVTGRVQDVKLLRSIPLLDQAAIDAVRLWQYEPTLLDGVPVPVIMTVTVQFTLN